MDDEALDRAEMAEMLAEWQAFRARCWDRFVGALVGGLVAAALVYAWTTP